MRSAVAETEVHAAAGCHRRQSRMVPAFAGDARRVLASEVGRTPDAVRTSKPTTYSDIGGRFARRGLRAPPGRTRHARTCRVEMEP